MTGLIIDPTKLDLNTPNTLGRKLGTKLANHYVAIPMVQPQSETYIS